MDYWNFFNNFMRPNWRNELWEVFCHNVNLNFDSYFEGFCFHVSFLISRCVFLSFVCQIYNKPMTKQVVISFIIMVCLSRNRNKGTIPGSKRIIVEPRVKIQYQRMHTYTHTHFLWIFSTNNYLIVSFKVAFHFTLVWISLYRCFSSISLYFFYCNTLAETLSEMFSSYSSSWFEQFFFSFGPLNSVEKCPPFYFIFISPSSILLNF